MTQSTFIVATCMETGPAALFVQKASKFSSNIKVIMDNKTVNAKSIMGIISLGILDGQEITISADGEDEKQAVFELENILTSTAGNND